MCLSISEMEVHGSVGEGVTLSVRVVVREWRVVHLGVTVLRHELDSILKNRGLRKKHLAQL